MVMGSSAQGYIVNKVSKIALELEVKVAYMGDNHFPLILQWSLILIGIIVIR